ncbi:MAG: DUF3298 domain-containing protein [Caldilineaceae bacterium]|nr:DUF3298 domain-containing protein [Caldilineaceae bacterium]MDE0179845.1 DUF3298 domain-containing protein [Caldilineaceae bacterium]
MKRKMVAMGVVLVLLLAFGASRLSAESVLTLEGLATAVTKLTIGQAALDARVSALESQAMQSDVAAAAYDAMPTNDFLQRVYTLRVVTFAESENEGRSTLKLSYVETDQRAINARIRDVSRAFIEDYREVAAQQEEGYQKELKETGAGPASFVTHYDQRLEFAVLNGSIISISVEQSMHTGGTGNKVTAGYIFNLKDGKELPISELFLDESYLERLSSLARERLASQLGDSAPASIFESGTAPEAGNFDTILFDEGGLVRVKFDKYQVASGVAGVVEMYLHMSDLEDLLKPEIRLLMGLEEGEGE